MQAEAAIPEQGSRQGFAQPRASADSPAAGLGPVGVSCDPCTLPPPEGGHSASWMGVGCRQTLGAMHAFLWGVDTLLHRWELFRPEELTPCTPFPSNNHSRNEPGHLTIQSVGPFCLHPEKAEMLRSG